MSTVLSCLYSDICMSKILLYIYTYIYIKFGAGYRTQGLTHAKYMLCPCAISKPHIFPQNESNCKLFPQ